MDRSPLALRLAAVAGALFAVAIVLFNASYSNREPLLRFGFPFIALLFHVGLGVALAGRFGDPAKRGKHNGLAIALNAVPVVLFWLMVYAIVQAIRTFT